MRRQFKGFFHVEPRIAIGNNPNVRFHVQGQKVAKSKHPSAFIRLIPITEQVGTGKEGEEPIDMPIVGENPFPLGAVRRLPS